jgi:hypothetical protein
VKDFDPLPKVRSSANLSPHSHPLHYLLPDPSLSACLIPPPQLPILIPLSLFFTLSSTSLTPFLSFPSLTNFCSLRPSFPSFPPSFSSHRHILSTRFRVTFPPPRHIPFPLPLLHAAPPQPVALTIAAPAALIQRLYTVDGG